MPRPRTLEVPIPDELDDLVTYTPGGFQIRLDNRLPASPIPLELTGLILALGLFLSFGVSALVSLPLGLVGIILTAILGAAAATRKANPSCVLLEIDGATLTFQTAEGSTRKLATHDVVRVDDDQDDPAIIVHTRTGSPLVLPCRDITTEAHAAVLTLLQQLERAQRQRDRDFRMDTERQRLSEMAMRPDREPK